MLVEAAHRLNVKTVILDAPNSPAKQINGLHAHVNGSFADAESIRKLAEECDILTIEIEHVDTTVLEELEASGKVEASLNSQESFQTEMGRIWLIVFRLLGPTLMENDSRYPRQIRPERTSHIPQRSHSPVYRHPLKHYHRP